MLQKLFIRNYAIIDELTITFDEQLNVITGETGAGKSIILGALSLILGDRADTSVLINTAEKCIVEASFLTEGNAKINDLLNAEDLDIDTITVIRREISANGKSRAFINDTPVNLTSLNNITAHLVDLHRQFDNYALKDRQFLYEVVDAIAENQELLSDYQQVFRQFKNLEKQLDEAIANQEEWQREADYKQFLYEELNTAGFGEQEIEEAETAIRQLSYAEQIKLTLNSVYNTLEAEEMAANTTIKRTIQQLSAIADVFPAADELGNRLESTLIELRDIAYEADSLQEKIDLNAEQLNYFQERVDLGYRLLKKHQVQTTAELIAIKQKLEADLSLHSNADDNIRMLKEALAETQDRLDHSAIALHQRRTNNSPSFSENVNQLLHLIGMPNASLKIEIIEKEKFDEFGKDDISMLWDANKSGNFQLLQKSASGGELSRIMLCIKTLTAKALAMPTLIFDEVDTGISGEAARQVGLLLLKLGQSHQVMSITHQPQIAARGSAHFFVYKVAENHKINTRIRKLSEEERIMALAQMIGGDNPSEAALKNARELMDR